MDKVKRQRADAYRVGFLKKLAELGILPSRFHAGVKQAFLDPMALLNPFVQGAADVGKGALSETARSLASTAGHTAVLAPLAIGGVTGIADAALNAPSPEDIENLRKAELIANYERLSKETSARRARRASMQ